jgi:hypothetical protein
MRVQILIQVSKGTLFSSRVTELPANVQISVQKQHEGQKLLEVKTTLETSSLPVS